MSYNRAQFEDLIRRTLDPLGLGGHKATHLLLGTAAVESTFGHYLRQTRGPALGAFQVEPETFQWLADRYVSRYLPELYGKSYHALEWDLRLSIVVARLRYLVDPQPLGDDLPAWAQTWKRVYNTSAGKGTALAFVAAYRRLVL